MQIFKEVLKNDLKANNFCFQIPYVIEVDRKGLDSNKFSKYKHNNYVLIS